MEQYAHRASGAAGKIAAAEAGTFDRTLQHGKLLTEGEVLEHEVSYAPTAEGEQRQQTAQDSHDNKRYHHKPQKSTLTGRMEFVRATANGKVIVREDREIGWDRPNTLRLSGRPIYLRADVKSLGRLKILIQEAETRP